MPEQQSDLMRMPRLMAQQYGLPLVRALIDLDLRDPEPQTVGADPADLTDVPHVPVSSMPGTGCMVTIVAYAGDEQEVADLLQARPDLKSLALLYGEDYVKQGVMDFALNAMTGQQVRNVERRTGINLDGGTDR